MESSFRTSRGFNTQRNAIVSWSGQEGVEGVQRLSAFFLIDACSLVRCFFFSWMVLAQFRCERYQVNLLDRCGKFKDRAHKFESPLNDFLSSWTLKEALWQLCCPSLSVGNRGKVSEDNRINVLSFNILGFPNRMHLIKRSLHDSMSRDHSSLTGFWFQDLLCIGSHRFESLISPHWIMTEYPQYAPLRSLHWLQLSAITALHLVGEGKIALWYGVKHLTRGMSTRYTPAKGFGAQRERREAWFPRIQMTDKENVEQEPTLEKMATQLRCKS